MCKNRLLQFYFEVISRKRKGAISCALRALLWLFSLCFSALVSLRLFLYRIGFLKITRLRPFTISVGNIVCGGTGKTPFTIFLANLLQKKYALAILTRGYKSESEHTNKSVRISSLEEVSVHQVGDEALLLAKRVPGVPIFVGKNRVQSGKMAEKEMCTCLLLDDGMQHRALLRDVEIVVIDAKNPFGYGYLLPRGLLREPLSALTRADLVVLNRVDQAENIPEIEAQIRNYTKAPLIKTRFVVDALYARDGTQYDPKTLQGKRLTLFCGIGHPENFVQTVKELGIEIVHTLFLADHEAISAEQLAEFTLESQSKGASCMLCTEKDAVKLSPFFETTLPLYWVGIRVALVSGDQELEKILDHS
jgi:tetraacyldisaccharide 4'-kinase